jgi:dephospho-CoA kinase
MGSVFWAFQALGRMAAGKDYVIDSIRNPGEVKALAESGDFILIAVDAPIETRFVRVLQRSGRDGKEPQTFEAFKLSEACELGSKNRSSQQLRECAQMADFRVCNDSGKDSFFKKIDDILIPRQTPGLARGTDGMRIP